MKTRVVFPWVILVVAWLLQTPAWADISGKVYQDFNANGKLDTGATFNEPGAAGVTVSAYAADGSQIATTATGADGTYNLTGLTDGASYRIEFAWTENWLKSGAAGGTSVQFAKDGVTGVNLGVNNPLDYSQADTGIFISTPVAIVGPSNQTIATGRDYRNLPALVKFPFNATGRPARGGQPASPGYIPPTPMATHEQIGSTSGAAFQRENQRLFVSAYYKRAVGFGPGGPGAIYGIDKNGDVNLHATIPDAGADTHDFTGDYTQVSYDEISADNAGKSSLGDMEISADGQWLYVVNLNNRHLYAVATNTTNTVSDLGEITRPAGCPDNDFRPFGLGMDATNTLYVGAVCTNESGTSPTGHPSAMILKYNAPSGFTETLSFDLFFNSQTFWKNWNDPLQQSYPYGSTSHQPMLSDIVFDGKDMVLAFRNRVWEAGYIPSGSTSSMSHILKACWNGMDWTLENNGTCGGVAGALPNYSVAAEAGPGGGYFFDMRDGLANINWQPIINALGSVAITPGRGMIATLSDPQYLISGGITHLNPRNGSASLPYEIFWGSADGSNGGGPSGYFGKTSGLGDAELLLDPAPTEIGNRVWQDTNGNGIQDADEPGIAGVQVKLLAADGTTELATATTAADGTYYFSSASGTSTTSAIYGISALQPGVAYTVQFPTTVAISGANYHLTTASVGGNRLIDSNASPAGTASISTVDVPIAGANNHSFDVGYTTVAPQTCTTISNTVTVSKLTGTTDPTVSNDSAAVAVQANCDAPAKIDLKLRKVADKTTVRHGDTLTYTITAENESDVDATGVKVRDDLPAGMTLIKATASQGTFANGEWTVGEVKARQAATLTLEVKVE